MSTNLIFAKKYQLDFWKKFKRMYDDYQSRGTIGPVQILRTPVGIFLWVFGFREPWILSDMYKLVHFFSSHFLD